MNKKCVCCKRLMKDVYPHQKYCGNCKAFTRELRRLYSVAKGQLKRLKISIYGRENGAERIRFNNQKEVKK